MFEYGELNALTFIEKTSYFVQLIQLYWMLMLLRQLILCKTVLIVKKLLALETRCALRTYRHCRAFCKNNILHYLLPAFCQRGLEKDAGCVEKVKRLLPNPKSQRHFTSFNNDKIKKMN